MAAETREGWTDFGGQARKFHFIPAEDKTALCGKWMISPFADEAEFREKRLHPETGPSSDDCVACRRKLEKRRVG